MGRCPAAAAAVAAGTAPPAAMHGTTRRATGGGGRACAPTGGWSCRLRSWHPRGSYRREGPGRRAGSGVSRGGPPPFAGARGYRARLRACEGAWQGHGVARVDGTQRRGWHPSPRSPLALLLLEDGRRGGWTTRQRQPRCRPPRLDACGTPRALGRAGPSRRTRHPVGRVRLTRFPSPPHFRRCVDTWGDAARDTPARVATRRTAARHTHRAGVPLTGGRGPGQSPATRQGRRDDRAAHVDGCGRNN